MCFYLQWQLITSPQQKKINMMQQVKFPKISLSSVCMHIKFSDPFICNRFPSELNFSSKQIETKEKSIRLNFTPINISGSREEF